MEPKETILLNWSDFQNNAANSFQDVRLSLKYSDVTLACEDSPTLIEAHKVILASGSTFFELVLDQIGRPHPLLFLSGLGRREVEAVLDFLYTGQARLPQGDLQEFLQAAQVLGVRGLQKTGQEDTTDRYTTKEEQYLPDYGLDTDNPLASEGDTGKTEFTSELSNKQSSQKTSEVWKYIEKLGNAEDGYTGAMCKLCGKILAWHSSTSGLLSHIQTKHWRIMDGFADIEDIKFVKPNSLIKQNDDILAIAQKTETDNQSLELSVTNSDKSNVISFDKNETTYKLWGIAETMTSENALEMTNDEERETVKMALSNRSPIWEFMMRTTDGFVKCMLCQKLLRSKNGTTSALIDHMLRNHKESKETKKLKRNILMKAHTRTSKRKEEKQKENSSFIKDMMMNVADDKWQCKLCAKFESSESEMFRHVTKHM